MSAAYDDGRIASWKDHALCPGMTDLFYSTNKADEAKAKDVCRHCSVTEQCLAEALELEHSANSVFGVRGGMTVDERKALRRQPRRGGR